MPSFVQVVPQRVGLPVSGVIGPGDGSSCWQWLRLLGVLLVEGGGKDDGYDDECDLHHDHINDHQRCDTRSITMYMTCLKAGSKQCANFVTIFIRLLLLILWCRAVCLLKTLLLVIKLAHNLYEGQGGVQLSWSVKLALRGTVQKGPMELVVVINIHKWNECSKRKCYQ